MQGRSLYAQAPVNKKNKQPADRCLSPFSFVYRIHSAITGSSGMVLLWYACAVAVVSVTAPAAAFAPAAVSVREEADDAKPGPGHDAEVTGGNGHAGDNTNKSGGPPVTATAPVATLKLLQKKGCAGCHGTKGQGRLSVTAPPLAGQSARELARKIRAFRAGETGTPAMRLMTRNLTDAEIDQLAGYYAQFPGRPVRRGDMEKKTASGSGTAPGQK